MPLKEFVDMTSVGKTKFFGNLGNPFIAKTKPVFNQPHPVGQAERLFILPPPAPSDTDTDVIERGQVDSIIWL
nr:hypothetical protein [Mucilaginibacter sp. JRF]